MSKSQKLTLFAGASSALRVKPLLLVASDELVGWHVISNETRSPSPPTGVAAVFLSWNQTNHRQMALQLHITDYYNPK